MFTFRQIVYYLLVKAIKKIIFLYGKMVFYVKIVINLTLLKQ